uniref:Uncharacterized protein n=1 Tax=Rhipicephalus zambeziensis TaxID=60191 RepID=A0A224YF73_9ACAR
MADVVTSVILNYTSNITSVTLCCRSRRCNSGVMIADRNKESTSFCHTSRLKLLIYQIPRELTVPRDSQCDAFWVCLIHLYHSKPLIAGHGKCRNCTASFHWCRHNMTILHSNLDITNPDITKYRL